MKILKQIALILTAIFILVSIVFFGLWLINAPTDLSEGSKSNQRLHQSPYATASIDIAFVDSSRDTPALGGYDGSDTRRLMGTIWYPENLNNNASSQSSAKHPLLIFSHGFGGYHEDSRHISKYLAGNGYVVAAVDFPLSNTRSPAGTPQLLDVVNQPGDVSAVIDHVLALNNDPNSVIHNRIDSARIGAYGLSLGGLTTALAVFHPDLADDRISVAAMMAPPLEAFSERFYASNPKVKSLILSGTMDRVVPELVNATQVKARHSNGWFLSLDKGTHLGFANVGNPIRWMENPDNVGCAFMNIMLSKLKLPERWDEVLPNTNGVLRDVVAGEPCPDMAGQSMNGLKQQWLTRIAIGSFFDMHFRSGDDAEAAAQFFSTTLSAENSEVSLTAPR